MPAKLEYHREGPYDGISFDDVDGGAYRACSVVGSSTALPVDDIVRSLGRLAPSSG